MPINSTLIKNKPVETPIVFPVLAEFVYDNESRGIVVLFTKECQGVVINRVKGAPECLGEKSEVFQSLYGDNWRILSKGEQVILENI